MKIKYVLAIESSCDDTSVSIVRDDGFVMSLISANQDKFHQIFGGVVPEIASRNHTLALLPLIEECIVRSGLDWNIIGGIAVTSRPGLVGALLVGLVTAKTLSLTKSIPFIGVNHLEGHLLAPFLKDKEYCPPENFDYPYLALAVSGGHTQLYNVSGFGKYKVLGKTLDDAAGEAFDKFGKMMNLGFPGGVFVDKNSKSGDVSSFSFPRSMLGGDNYNFSFSGLKSSAKRLIESMLAEELKSQTSNLCASYQEAIVDVLLAKMEKAVVEFNIPRVVITGGVSANSRLRECSATWAKRMNCAMIVPPIRYCTDNAAMIGYAGVKRLNNGEASAQNLAPSPRVYENDFQ